jgi:hypothetical protein
MTVLSHLNSSMLAKLPLPFQVGDSGLAAGKQKLLKQKGRT